MRRRAPGFTLIELLLSLVLITMLVAILVPTLKGARYQARLARCGANLSAVGKAVCVYAGENREYYPTRTVVRTGGQPTCVYFRGADDRPVLTRALGTLDTLNCPLAGSIQMGRADTRRSIDVKSPYGLWFGYRLSTSQRAMAGPGEGLGWASGGKRYSFTVLAGDWDYIDDATPRSLNAHPDADQQLGRFVAQDQAVSADYQSLGMGARTDVIVTIARWQVWNRPDRGPVDNNYVYEDGSVRLLDGVAWLGDPRMVAVPWTINSTAAPRRVQLPRP